MSSHLFESLTGWVWKLRLDLDLAQRCLAIVAASWLFRAAIDCLPACIGDLTVFAWLELWITLALAAAVAKSAVQLKPTGKSVLITGCDTGFGLALAKHLHDLGFKVFAGCLLASSGGAGAEQLRAHSRNLHVLQLDVTKDDDWQQALEYVTKHTKNRQLWGLVNNAGWSTYGEVEWVSMQTYERITNINLFGVIRGVKKFLPLIRKARGRVVTVSSGIAIMAVPSRSPYVMTKYALEGLHDCLRYEMEAFGVKVSLLEPGNYIAGTNIFSEEHVRQQAELMRADMSDEVRESYGQKYFEQRVEIMRSYMNTGLADVAPVVNAYTDALLDVFPQKRYQPMNLYFKVRSFVAIHLPEVVYDTIYVPSAKRGS